MKVLLALLMVVAMATPAKGEPIVYWQDQCNGVITWSSNGKRDKIVRQTIIFLDAAMPHYSFVRVSTNADANITIAMAQPDNPDFWGLTWVMWTGNDTMMGADVEIYVNKNRNLISSVLLHELFHAVGIDHIDSRPSLMNSYPSYFTPSGSVKIWPADWQTLRTQDGLCK